MGGGARVPLVTVNEFVDGRVGLVLSPVELGCDAWGAPRDLGVGPGVARCGGCPMFSQGAEVPVGQRASRFVEIFFRERFRNPSTQAPLDG